MSQRVRLFVSVTTVALAAIPADAQTGRPQVEAGFAVGTVQGVGAAFGCVTAHPTAVGLRGRYRPVARFAFEVGIDRIGVGDDRFCLDDPPYVPPAGPYVAVYTTSDVSYLTFPFTTAGLRFVAWPLLTPYASARIHFGLLWMNRLGPIAPALGAGVELGPRAVRVVAEAELSQYRYTESTRRVEYRDRRVVNELTSSRRRYDRTATLRVGLSMALTGR